MMYEFTYTHQGPKRIVDKVIRRGSLRAAQVRAADLLGTIKPKIDQDGYAVGRNGDCVTPRSPLTIAELFPEIGETK